MIIEEIAGIGVYEDKKQKALRELEKVEEKLREAEIVLTERETHLKELKNDRDHAIQYKDIQDKITSNKASYLKAQIDAKEVEKSNFDKLIAEHQKKIDTCQKEIDDNKKIVLDKKAETKRINEEIEKRGASQDQTRCHYQNNF